MLFDVNSGSMEQYYVGSETETKYFDNLARSMNSDTVFRSLLQNSDFKKLFIERLFYAGENYFSGEKMMKLIDQYFSTYSVCLEASYKRWYGSKYSGIKEMLALDKAFFQNRMEVINLYVLKNLTSF